MRKLKLLVTLESNNKQKTKAVLINGKSELVAYVIPPKYQIMSAIRACIERDSEILNIQIK